MIDLALATLKLLLVIHPVMAAATWLATSPAPAGRRASRLQLLVAVGSLLALAIAALVAEGLVDLLDISEPTFTLSTGALVLLSIIPVWVPLPRIAAENRHSSLAIARLWIWMASPAVAVLAVQVSLDEGVVTAVDASVLAMLGALAILLVTARLPVRVVPMLPWLARLLSIAVAIIAVQLIFTGIDSI